MAPLLLRLQGLCFLEGEDVPPWGQRQTAVCGSQQACELTSSRTHSAGQVQKPL